LKLTHNIIFTEVRKQVVNNNINLYVQAASAQHTEQSNQHRPQAPPTLLLSPQLPPPPPTNQPITAINKT